MSITFTRHVVATPCSGLTSSFLFAAYSLNTHAWSLLYVVDFPDPAAPLSSNTLALLSMNLANALVTASDGLILGSASKLAFGPGPTTSASI